ncbi:MAG TPA: glycosyltransferase family 2 protein, partial [Roseiflexaceae bacterium]|nr:glycosyltransferase family 2 protein [Roseiflexaceae bacterium]
MKPIMPISVAISTRNRATALARCLEALAHGTAWPAEVVIVDQSSDDHTRHLATQWQPGLPITYIHQQGNGLGRAQNLAIANSTQPIVAVTDDDCVPTPEWLAMIMRAFEPGQQIVAVTGRVLPLGPPQAGRYPVASRTGTARIDFDRRAMPWSIGSGNNFAVKREWLLRIGSNN